MQLIAVIVAIFIGPTSVEGFQYDPSDAAGFLKRGRERLEKKDYDKAINGFTKAIALDSTSDEAFLNRGFAWSMKKEYEKAIADYTWALALE